MLCPRCESPNLIHFENDFICRHCSWDSIDLNADALFTQRTPARSYEDDTSYGHQESAFEFAHELLFESPFLSLGQALV